MKKEKFFAFFLTILIVTNLVTFTGAFIGTGESMAANSRFYMAVHILVLLAMYPEERLTSENIARSVGTNPVIIRRIMGQLRGAGLVTAKIGAGGGSELARPPEKIPLSEVYRAVEGAVIIPHANPNQCCFVGRCIHDAIKGIADSVETNIDKTLYSTTIAHTVEKIRAQSKKG